MTRSEQLASWMLSGALAGLAGGVVFGAAMLELEVLDSIASVVRAEDSFGLGVAAHFTIAAIVGAGFGALVWHQRLGAAETVLWGVTYGALWWFVGPLTLRRIIAGDGIAWDLPSAQAAFPPLLGHLLYGASTGLALLVVRRASLERPSSGALIRGAIAGLVPALLVGRLLDVQGRLPVFAALPADQAAALAWLALLAIATGGGIVFALLVPSPRDSAGAAVVRGAVYGFVLWVVLNRSLLPLIAGDGLPWSVNDAREDFAALFAYLLLGAGIALGEQWLDALRRTLFADELGADEDEGAGTQGLRAIARGALAGVVGGLLFTYVMVEIGALDNVGNIVRVESGVVGIVVHFAIAVSWGATYGLLFRRQTYDRGSAIGWGVSFGFVVWVLGPNTLLPILLGGTPDWTAESAAGLTASLVGHLAYGAGLGLTFHYFEARFSPWWIPQRMADAARAQRRREQVLTSAPAIWALVVVVALTLPVMLSTAATASHPIYGAP